MIVDALLALLTGILNGLYSLLPNWSWANLYSSNTYDRGEYGGAMPFPADQWGMSYSDSPVSSFVSLLSKFNIVLPIYEAMILLNAVLTFAIGYAAWRGIAWIIGVVRGSGTSG